MSQVLRLHWFACSHVRRTGRRFERARLNLGEVRARCPVSGATAIKGTELLIALPEQSDAATRKPFPPAPCPMAEHCIAPAPAPVASPTVRPYHAVDYR